MTDISIADQIASPDTYADPGRLHALFAMLRRDSPLLWAEPSDCRPFWVASSHELVGAIERDNRLFVNAPRTALRTHAQEAAIIKATGSTQAARTMLQMDEPDHLAYRKLTRDWFSPGGLRDLQPTIAQVARDFIDRMMALQGHCDFAADVAMGFPLRVLSTVLGVPEDDEILLQRLTQEHLAASDPASRVDDDAGAADPAKALFAYFTQLTAIRREDPRNDIVSLLADAEIDGTPISDFDRNSYYFILLIGGHDTTSSALSGTLHALIERPDQLTRLREDRSLLDGAISEGLRWSSPVRHFFRTATTDTRIAGPQISAGDSIMLSYPSANFDENAFDDPTEFRIDRSPNPQLAFGLGVHRCLGQHLARLEMRALLTELLDRVDSVHLDGEPRYARTNFVGGLRSLPIRYTERAGGEDPVSAVSSDRKVE